LIANLERVSKVCGRFTLKTPPDEWGQLLLPLADFASLLGNWQPRYNIAPTQPVLAIANNDRGQACAGYYRWGLVPGWATDLSIGNRMINARRESLAEKKSFTGPLARRRCLILADGYYEWQKLDSKRKQAYWISPRCGGVMQLAGLWETNSKATGSPIQSCTIITTAANASMSALHDRMPVVLSGEDAQQWMNPESTSETAWHALQPPAEDLLEPRKVSSHVNNPRHDDEACLLP
jgi:putative SOS response-associated peptidase YedK